MALMTKKTNENHNNVAETDRKQSESEICQKKIVNTPNDCRSILVLPQTLAGRGVTPGFFIIRAKKAIDASKPTVDSISEVKG